MKKQLIYIVFIVFTGIIAFNACKKETVRVEPDEPDNPYDAIDYGSETNPVLIDSSSFLGLHTYIFSTTCAVPGCHDGAFEPDFRTVQSTYNTLVYHPVLKNDASNTFTYRVVPGDTALSWLHERVTTDDPVLGRMPLYDELTQGEIEAIETWILDGAKDVFGNSPAFPDMQPATFGVIAYEDNTSGLRLDTNRADIVSPIKFPQNSTVQVWFGLYDTDVAGDFLPGYGFTDNTLKISPDPFDFSVANSLPLTLENPLTPFMGPIPFGGTTLAPYYHSYMINTANYPVGQTQYMRVYVKDADHSFSTELPEDGSQLYLLTFFSFIVE